MLSIRLMQTKDLPAVVKLQDRCYAADLFEPADVVKNRLLACPQSSWVAEFRDKLWGYLFCYPSQLGKVGPLAAEFIVSARADCLYLHDMAVSSDARGQGVATALLASAEQYAQSQHYQALTLVAVQNSASYWQRHHFAAYRQLSAAEQQHLASYIGQQAEYMVKTL